MIEVGTYSHDQCEYVRIRAAYDQNLAETTNMLSPVMPVGNTTPPPLFEMKPDADPGNLADLIDEVVRPRLCQATRGIATHREWVRADRQPAQAQWRHFPDGVSPVLSTLPPRRERIRQRRHVCTRFIRWLPKGACFQIRFWLRDWGTVNMGLFKDEFTAERVRTELIHELSRHPLTALGLWHAAQAVSLRDRTAAGRAIPDEARRVLAALLPMYVRHGPEGYSAAVKKAGETIVCPGPFATPEEAHTAMIEALRKFRERKFRELVPATVAYLAGGGQPLPNRTGNVAVWAGATVAGVAPATLISWARGVGDNPMTTLREFAQMVRTELARLTGIPIACAVGR